MLKTPKAEASCEEGTFIDTRNYAKTESNPRADQRGLTCQAYFPRECPQVLLHRAVHQFHLQEHTVPFHAFCPLPYAGFLNRFVFPHNCVWPANSTTDDDAAYAIHCYNSLWSFAKDRGFHQYAPASFYSPFALGAGTVWEASSQSSDYALSP